MTWLIDDYLSGFPESFGTGSVRVYQVLLGLAMLAEFGAEVLSPRSTNYGGDSFIARRARRLYSIDYPSRGVAVVQRVAFGSTFFVISGLLAPLFLTLIILWLLIEASINYKSHTWMFLLSSVSLLVIHISALPASLSTGLVFGSLPWLTSTSTVSSLGPWMAVVLTCVIYIVAALRKPWSKEFMDGSVVADAISVFGRAKPPLGHFYFGVPRSLCVTLSSARFTTMIWRPAAYLTIVTELAIPVLLLSGGVAFVIGCLVGLVMHTAFAILIPNEVVPFGIGMVSTYCLFLH